MANLQNLILLARTSTLQSLFSMVSNSSIGEEYAFDLRARLRLHIWTIKKISFQELRTRFFSFVPFSTVIGEEAENGLWGAPCLQDDHQVLPFYVKMLRCYLN